MDKYYSANDPTTARTNASSVIVCGMDDAVGRVPRSVCFYHPVHRGNMEHGDGCGAGVRPGCGVIRDCASVVQLQPQSGDLGGGVRRGVGDLSQATMGTDRVGAAYPDRCAIPWEWVLSHPDIFPDLRMEIYPRGIMGASGVHDGELYVDAPGMDGGGVVSTETCTGQEILIG